VRERRLAHNAFGHYSAREGNLFLLVRSVIAEYIFGVRRHVVADFGKGIFVFALEVRKFLVADRYNFVLVYSFLYGKHVIVFFAHLSLNSAAFRRKRLG